MGIYTKRWSTKRLTQNEVINKFISVHGGIYDYSMTEYKTMKTPIIIICHTHGTFTQTPDRHAAGNGCPSCGQLSRSKSKSYTSDEIIEKFIEIYGTKYDYSLAHYNGYNKKIKIICPTHGVFEKTPANHINSQGCKKCMATYLSELYKIPPSTWVDRFKQTHGDLYNYSLVDHPIDNKVKIICPVHGIFEQHPKSHWKGHGCSRCSGKSISKIGSKWLDSLNVPIREHQITKSRQFLVDGFDPETNTVYEFYGDYWHGNPNIYNRHVINAITKCTFGELYDRTIKRAEFIKQLGFNLITMWENDYKSIFVRTKRLESGKS